MKITQIISGGQTGADRGGLEAAVHCGLLCGGWVPKRWRAEDGTIPATYIHLGLRETGSSDYAVRTEANVVDSDATLVFCHGSPTGGSKKTVELAAKHLRPCLVVDLDEPRQEVVKKIVVWLQGIQEPSDGILNVAGSRASKSPSIERSVMVRLVDVISKVNGKLFYPLAEEG